MAKDKLSDYDGVTAGNNTDIGGISIAEGMLPSAVNNSLRELTKQLGAFADGTDGIDVLNLHDDDASASIKIQAPATVTTTTTLTLPDGAGSSGQTLTTNGSGTLSWTTPTTYLANIVEDTTPQLGGTLSTNGNDITFGDNDKATFGDAINGDLQIWHDGSNSNIKDNGTGNLKLLATNFALQNSAANHNAMVYTDGGAVSLYHNNSKKFETSAAGTIITGTLYADGVVVGDSEKIQLGNSQDFQMYHTGSASFIDDAGTGNIYLRGSSQVIIGNMTGEQAAVFNDNGAVTLNYDNVQKLATTSYGLVINGSVVADTHTASVTGAQTADFSTYQNFVWTLTGNITLSNPTTEKTGQSGFFIFVHSGGARTVSLGTDYETAGGAGLTLSSTSGAVDVVPYIVKASGSIQLGTPQLAFS